MVKVKKKKEIIKENVKHKYEELHETAGRMKEEHKKIVSIMGLLIFVIFCLAVSYFIGRPMMEHLAEPEDFRKWVNSYGMFSWLLCIGMMVLQIIVAIIPGGALEIGIGYAFGTIIGGVLCVIGSVIGSALVFQFSRCFGIKLVEAFFPIEKIRNLRFLHDEKIRNRLSFVIFLIPGTPKDLLSYFMGLTEMDIRTWLLISTIARAPAIFISTMSGDALGEQKYPMAIIVLVVLMLGSVIGALYYKYICNKQNKENEFI